MTNPGSPGIKTDKRQFLKDLVLVLVVCTLLSAIVIIPFFIIGEKSGSGCCAGAMPVTHDMVMHLNQMQAFYDGLVAGRPYPRWNAQTNRGFGAPTTIFYPPLTYYLTSALYSVTRDWVTVIKLFYLAAMIASALAFYALARQLFPMSASMLATACYTFMPYHLLNHYQRGAFAECLSFVFIPLMAFFLLRLIRESPNTRTALILSSGLAIVWGLFIWAHPPTAYQFQLIALPVTVVTGIWRRSWKGLSFIAIALVVGLMLSAAYLIPASMEQGYIHADDVAQSWPYHESYVLYPSSRYDHANDDFIVRLDRIWLFGSLLLIVVASTLVLLKREAPRPDYFKVSFAPWLGASILASVMMLAVSKPIGSLIPMVEIGVFAWRMLALTAAGLSLLLGYLAVWVINGKQWNMSQSWRVFPGAVLVVSCVSVVALSLTLVVLPMYRAEAFKPDPDHSNYSLVPTAGGKAQPVRDEVTFLKGRGQAEVKKWDPEWRVADIEMTEAGTVGFRCFNYPGWSARDGDTPAAITTGVLGEINLDLATGHHSITLEFQNTAVRNLALLTSVLGAIVIAVGLGLASKKDGTS